MLDTDMPDHDLQPPRFSRTALEQLLDDWAAVKAMIMSGVSDSNGDEQSGTALLDKFTYRLLSKCSPDVRIINKIPNKCFNFRLILTIYEYCSR